MVQKIIAIGGGSIGFGPAKPEVTSLSREIISFSGQQHPLILFIPTASSDDEAYIRAFQNHFGHKLGCRIEVLRLISEKPKPIDIKRMVLKADVIYVGGGNTLLMINRWKKLGLDRLLTVAKEKGKVLCGTSAGAICWFRQGNSDSRKFLNPKAKLIKVTGLGFINALACPHYDVEKNRKPELKNMMKNTPGVALAMENCSALQIMGDQFRVLKSKPNAKIYKVYWRNQNYHQEILPADNKWRLLLSLVKKADIKV